MTVRSCWISCIVAMTLPLAAWTPAAGQSGIAVEALELSIWPEYDQPSVLVIYRIQLVPAAGLPAPVSFRIPAAAGSPNAVAERQPDGRLSTIPYERRVEGDWAFLDFTASRPHVQIEYYDPRLERDGDLRRYAFEWSSSYAVGPLTLSVQQPTTASNLATTPAASRRAASSDGLTYHEIDLPGAAPDTPVEVTVQYEKTTDRLSVEARSGASNDWPPEPDERATSIGRWIAIGGIAAVVLASIALLYRLRGTATTTQAASAGPGRSAEPARPAAAGRVPDAAPGDPVKAAFCTRCGARAEPEDRFCHACGTALSGR